MNSPVALSYGWSIIGSQCRALSGQFSLKAVRSPWMLFIIRSPPAGMPRYVVVHETSPPAVAGCVRVILRRLPSCVNGAGFPSHVTADTVMPVAPRRLDQVERDFFWLAL